jgi:hypothetical protein
VNLAQPATGDVAGQPSVTTEGGRTVVSFTVDVAAGGRQSVTLDLRLPPEPPASYRWYLVPTPRVRPTQVDMDVKFGEGALRYRGPLDRLVALP